MKRNTAKFLRLGERWQRRLWLGDWDVDYVRVEDLGESGQDGFEEAAQVQTHPRYQKASVKVSESALVKMTDKELNQCSCHEMLHVLTSPITEVAQDLIDLLPEGKRQGWQNHLNYVRESVTEKATQAFLWAEKADKKRW